MDKEGTSSADGRIKGPPALELAHYKAIVEHSQDIVSVLNPKGIFRFASPSIRTHLGYAPDAMIGQSVFQFVHPEDQKAAAAKLQRGLASPGSPQQVEVRLLHKDGTWRVYECFGAFSSSSVGEPLIVVNSRDITARVITMQALRASEQR